MPMYPYGNSENAPAAGMGESGGSNEAIPPAAAASSEPAPHGFPISVPGGFTEPGEPSEGPSDWSAGEATETVQSLGLGPVFPGAPPVGT